MTIIKSFDHGEVIVSMVVFNNKLYIATNLGVYVKNEDDKFDQLEIVKIVDEPKL